MDETLRTQIKNAFVQHFLRIKKGMGSGDMVIVERAVLIELRFLESEILQAIEDYVDEERGG